MVVVAVVGMCGAGKTTVAKIFEDNGFKYVRFGQVVLDEVKRRGLQPSEKLEREIREGLRTRHGPQFVGILTLEKIQAMQGNVVADGLYSWTEYKLFKEALGASLIIVAVTAAPSVRYARLSARTTIDAQMINRPFTEAEARERDYSEIENLEKGGPIAMADITFVNDGTPEELAADVRAVLATIHKK